MATKTSRYDAADYLKTEEDIRNYLNAALELGEPDVFAKALGDVARARGMTSISKSTGLTRETLYRTLSEIGNPQLDSLLKILGALGVKLVVEPLKPTKASTQRRMRKSPASRIA